MADTPRARILIVADESAQTRALCDTLRSEGYETAGFTSAHETLAALREARFELLLIDLMMPAIDGIALVRSALAIDPNVVGIMMTGEGTIAMAVEAMKTGAFDYILQPFKLNLVLPVLSRALDMRRLLLEKAELEQRVHERTTELEELNKELENFSYAVSHDLRAPLRAIDGFSNILLRQFSAQMPAEAQRLLGHVNASAREMGHLIEDLLRFSRLRRETLSKHVVNVTVLVHAVITELRGKSAGREIEIHVGQLPDCLGDPNLLRHVFVNLLSNSFKFTRRRDKAVIEVGCSLADENNTYFVRDNGAGFDLRHAKNLFGVFQRFHKAEEFEGTGVGLSIVHRIIQRHGGRIWAESEPEKGATFYFSLPGCI